MSATDDQLYAEDCAEVDAMTPGSPAIEPPVRQERAKLPSPQPPSVPDLRCSVNVPLEICKIIFVTIQALYWVWYYRKYGGF